MSNSLINVGKIEMKILTVLITLWFNVCESSNITYDQDIGYKLPTTVFPRNYKLEIATLLSESEGFGFTGKVWITVSINKVKSI